jgi:hypothetical protein
MLTLKKSRINENCHIGLCNWYVLYTMYRYFKYANGYFGYLFIPFSNSLGKYPKIKFCRCSDPFVHNMYYNRKIVVITMYYVRCSPFKLIYICVCVIHYNRSFFFSIFEYSCLKTKIFVLQYYNFKIFRETSIFI